MQEEDKYWQEAKEMRKRLAALMIDHEDHGLTYDDVGHVVGMLDGEPLSRVMISHATLSRRQPGRLDKIKEACNEIDREAHRGRLSDLLKRARSPRGEATSA